MNVIIKWFIKLALFPVILLLAVLEWVGICIANFAGILCQVAAGAVLLLTIVAWLTGIASAEQIVITFKAGVLLYLVPLVARFVITCVAWAKVTLTDITQ